METVAVERLLPTIVMIEPRAAAGTLDVLVPVTALITSPIAALLCAFAVDHAEPQSKRSSPN
jgi:hypothetical protein